MSHRQNDEQGLEGQQEEEVAAAKEVATPEEVPAAGDSQEACSSSASNQASSSSQASQDSRQGGQSTSKAYVDSKILLNRALWEKVKELVKFLSFKYVVNEPVTEAEILQNVVKEYQDHYTMVFTRACECMEVVFGIEVKEVDAFTHSYVLLKILDLSYDGRLSNDEGIPKTGLLAFVLGVIFMEGNRAPEKKIWEVLDKVGVHPDKSDFMCENPRKFITEELVLENYLVYQLVPHSDPPCYEFLWGPRAHAETSKMKVLQFVSKVAGSNPTSFAALYREALKDEEERALARLATIAIATPTAPDNSGSGDEASNVSHPE